MTLKPAILIVSTLVLIACDIEVPEDSFSFYGEGDITTVVITYLNDDDDTDEVVITFRDLDDNGRADESIQVDTLKLGATYTSSIQLLDENQSPAVDLTRLLTDRGDETQIFYEISSFNAILDLGYLDRDGNGKGIGQSLRWEFGTVPTTINVRLIIQSEMSSKDLDYTLGNSPPTKNTAGDDHSAGDEHEIEYDVSAGV